MSKPDILLSKYAFMLFIGFLVILLFSLYMSYLQLSAECSNPNDANKNKKKGINIGMLLLFVLVCSMTAQAINQSYTRINISK